MFFCSIGEILFQNCECSSIFSVYDPIENENKILKLRVKSHVDIVKVCKKPLWYLLNMNFQKKCYNPSKKHRKAVKMNLKIIDLEMANEMQTLQLIPGQKLCKICYAKGSKQYNSTRGVTQCHRIA